MKFRLEWLGSYLPGPLPSASELRERLTSVGFIVEGVEGEGPEAILEVEVTANRPDGMNHRGLAREAAAALARPFVDGGAPAALPETGPDVSTLATVTIEEAELCSRYSARVIEGLGVGPASAAVRERLQALGMNPISAPVDATNHVLWDIGQPLHAFDLDKLAKGQDGLPAIVVRRARAGERLVTLDGVDRELSPDHLVIADAEKPVALAGVMGGLESAIGLETKRILLESAHFQPSIVRKTARALGMHTDASHRFERGTDPRATVQALDRAAAMILADCGGTLAKGVVDTVAREIPLPVVRLRFPRVAAFLGLEVPLERALAIFRALGLSAAPAGDGSYDVTVPSWRVDLGLEVDLVEEVIRHVGYTALPETLPRPFNPERAEPVLAREEKVRDVLAGAGFFETSTYSFVSAEENAPFASLAPGAPPEVENPLGEPFSVMRATPVASLLRVARHNVRRGQRDLRLFEVGRGFGMGPSGPAERRLVSVLVCGERQAHWDLPPAPVDFYDGSGAIATILAGLGLPAPAFEPVPVPFLAPGRSARVVLPGGVEAGWVGVLARTLAERWDLGEVVVAELDLGALPPFELPLAVAAPSRFPGSEFDLTVTHPLSLPYARLVAAVREGAPPELESVETRSRYRGPGVAEGSVKTSVGLRFGAADRSLSRDEVNGWRDAAARRILALGETRVDGIE